MADFNNAVMTTEGVSLLAKTAAGSARIKFTKLATGSGTYTETEKMVENLQVRTSLKEPKQEVPFSSISMVSATCIKLTAIISNETLISGYHVNEVGIFAVDEMDRDAEPILYSIAVANVADYLPPYNGLVISTISQEYYATVNNSSEVVIHTNLGAVALADDLNALKKEVRTNGKTFIASGGNFEIPELGINKEATLKELCEAMVTYRIDNNTNHVRVDWWINTASKIGNEVRDRLNFTYGNLNLICQNRTVYLTLKKYYDAENPAKVYICTYTKENNANSFSVWTTLEDMTKTVERLEKAIEDAEALRASPTVYGMTKITNSAAVTDSTGLALAATEKNATIGGTLANQLAQLNTDFANLTDHDVTKAKGAFFQDGYSAIVDSCDGNGTHTALNVYPALQGAIRTSWSTDFDRTHNEFYVGTVPGAERAAGLYACSNNSGGDDSRDMFIRLVNRRGRSMDLHIYFYPDASVKLAAYVQQDDGTFVCVWALG